MSLKSSKAFRKCYATLQLQIPELQFFKTLFFVALFKSDKLEYILAFFLFKVILSSLLTVVPSSIGVRPN